MYQIPVAMFLWHCSTAWEENKRRHVSHVEEIMIKTDGKGGRSGDNQDKMIKKLLEMEV